MTEAQALELLAEIQLLNDRIEYLCVLTVLAAGLLVFSGCYKFLKIFF